MRLGRDLLQAVRVVRRQRLVSGLAIVAFALGIGVTTAVFSIFNSVLLTPLDYPDSDRLVLVYDTQPACSTCPAKMGRPAPRAWLPARPSTSSPPERKNPSG